MIDQALYAEIQIALLEPANGGATYPSGLWTPDEVVACANQRQGELLKKCGIVVAQAALPVVAGQSRVTLPEDWQRTTRVVWAGADGRVRALGRDDTWSADTGLSTWGTATGMPLVYMDEEAPTLTIQIAPAPDVAGTLTVFYLPLGAPLDRSGVELTVPDELAAGLKYGILADLLRKDGRGRDVGRAAYAELRFGLEADLARLILRGWA